MNKSFIFTVCRGFDRSRCSTAESAINKIDALKDEANEKYLRIMIQPLDVNDDDGRLYVEMDARTFRKAVDNDTLSTILENLG